MSQVRESLFTYCSSNEQWLKGDNKAFIPQAELQRQRAQGWLGRSIHGVLRDSFHRFAISMPWPPPHGPLGWVGHWLSQPHSTELDGGRTESTSCLPFQEGS